MLQNSSSVSDQYKNHKDIYYRGALQSTVSMIFTFNSVRKRKYILCIKKKSIFRFCACVSNDELKVNWSKLIWHLLYVVTLVTRSLVC